MSNDDQNLIAQGIGLLLFGVILYSCWPYLLGLLAVIGAAFIWSEYQKGNKQ